MRIGQKAQGQAMGTVGGTKACCEGLAHLAGRRVSRTKARVRRALETKVRQAGRKACREAV